MDEALLEKLMGRQQRRVLGIPGTEGVANPLYAGIKAFTTGKMDDDTDENKLYNAMMMENYKSQLANENKTPEYVVSYDESGSPVFTQAPGRVKNAPFYASGLGERFYGSKIGQAEAMGSQAKTETELMDMVKEEVQKAMSGQGGQGVPPGTTVQAGPINYPVNPKLTESEQGVIGGVRGMEPIIGEIKKSLESGILDSGMGDLGRTFNQLRADRQSALFTATNPKLQQLQSQLNTLKKTIPFTEGGKQLTSTEKAMVMALLNISGKSNVQIKNDINQAMQILRAKEQLALGGRNVAMQGQLQTQPTQSGQATNNSDSLGIRG